MHQFNNMYNILYYTGTPFVILCQGVYLLVGRYIKYPRKNSSYKIMVYTLILLVPTYILYCIPHIIGTYTYIILL